MAELHPGSVIHGKPPRSSAWSMRARECRGAGHPSKSRLPRGLATRLAELFPGARIVSTHPLGDDETRGESEDAPDKALGYGHPVRITLATAGAEHEVVFHTQRADEFGHDRRADRIANAVLAYDTFPRIPRHVAALDAGVIAADGELVSLAGSGEPYFITPWQAGHLYADDLQRVAARGIATALDVARLDALVDALIEIHAGAGSHPAAYTRAIRDLLGHGEGIFGLVDSYADDTPGAPAGRLFRIEQACHDWRWRLRRRVERLRRIHGDLHPYNILFDDGTEVSLLDASRGAEGDPADDVACLAINFLFFGLGTARTGGLERLWTRLFTRYCATSSVDVLAAMAPFLAWRGLVIASPRWYPDLAPADRERVLAFIEHALTSERFDPASGLDLLRRISR